MFRLINKLKNRKGFTLIELIVVLAVLAIIMAIAVPRFIGVQKDAETKADAATDDMISKAAELYFVNHAGDSEVTVSELQGEGLLGDVEYKSITVAVVGNVKATITNATTGAVTVTHP